MIVMFGNTRPLALAGLTLALAGCSLTGKTEPSPGDRMIAEGEAVADLGKMWNDGSEMVKRADSLATEGARLKERGRKNIEEGRTLTENGRALVEQQQHEYAGFAETIGPLITLERARKRQDHLNRVVDKWQDGLNRMDKGQELVKKGQSRIAEGESKLAESDRLRRRGHELMQKAEQRYNAEGAVPAGLTH